MWPFTTKKQEKSENQAKIADILNSLVEKVDKIEENHAKLKGFTYRKAKVLTDDDDADQEKEQKGGGKMVYQGVEITEAMGIPKETLQWIKDNDPI